MKSNPRALAQYNVVCEAISKLDKLQKSELMSDSIVWTEENIGKSIAYGKAMYILNLIHDRLQVELAERRWKIKHKQLRK